MKTPARGVIRPVHRRFDRPPGSWVLRVWGAGAWIESKSGAGASRYRGLQRQVRQRPVKMLQARERYRAAVIMISTMASADMRREPTTVVLTPGASI